MPAAAGIEHRLGTVLQTIYLLFNEGYAATSGTDLVREQLSAEAIRLGRLLLGRRNFGMGRIGRRGSTRRRTAVVAVLRLLAVEVVRWARWANACHGTDRTDTRCRRVQ